MSWERQWSHYWNKSNNFYTIVRYSNNITKNIEYRLVWKVPGIRFSVFHWHDFPWIESFLWTTLPSFTVFLSFIEANSMFNYSVKNYVHKCNISWLYLPFHLLATPLLVSPLKLHGLLSFIHLFLTHWIQLILPICSHTWGHPPGYRKPTTGHTLKGKRFFIFLPKAIKSQQLLREGWGLRSLCHLHVGILIGLIFAQVLCR